jgi:hypothetical protein
MVKELNKLGGDIRVYLVGQGSLTNTIGWGIIYKPEASQDTWNYQQSEWETENNKWNNI